MDQKNIAIVSPDKDFARFLELELLLMNHRIEVLSSADELEDRFDCIMLDGDLVKEIIGVYNCPIVSFFEDASEPVKIQDTYNLPKPCQLDIFHDVLGEIFDTHKKIPRHITEKKDDVIYITDPKRRYAVIDNCHLKLTSCELQVLEELCAAGGEVVSREQLARTLGAESGNLVDVYVCYLRRKLERPLNRKLIFAARGVGYKTTLKLQKTET